MLDIHELLTATDDGVELSITATPGAGRTEIIGRQGGALKVRAAAPPATERANGAITALLASLLGVEEGAVIIVAGADGRTKHVTVTGVEIDDAAKRLEEAFVAGGRKGPRPRR